MSGRLYVTEKGIYFYSNIFGWVTSVSIMYKDIVSIEKKFTAYVISNAIQISTIDQKYFFTSFLFRDSVYLVILHSWGKICPNRVTKPKNQTENNTDKNLDSNNEENTYCPCYKPLKGEHVGSVHGEAIYQTNVDTIFKIMFGQDNQFTKSQFEKDKCSDIKIGDFEPVEDGPLTRKISFIKPLNNPIGPKQTKCYITEKILTGDPENYCQIETNVLTPDVPSGTSFEVVVMHCLMIYKSNMTRHVITSKINWSKSSWLKGTIEGVAKSSNDQNAKTIQKSIQDYLKDHPDLITSNEKVEEITLKPKNSETKENTPSLINSFKNIKIHSLMYYVFALSILIMIVINLFHWFKINSLKSQYNHSQKETPPESKSQVQKDKLPPHSKNPLNTQASHTDNNKKVEKKDLYLEILYKINENLEEIKKNIKSS